MRSTAPRQNDHVRHKTNQRDLAIARVSRLTTGTAVAGTLATFGFAGLAALTFSGNVTATDDSQLPDNGISQDAQGLNQQQAQTDQNGSASTNGAQATPANGSSTNTNPNNGSTSVNPPVVVNPPSVTTHRRSHVSTGGSH